MDALLAARVRGQLGLVTWRQCRDADITMRTVLCHLEAGRWLKVHPGVYLTEPGRNEWQVSAMAALLACGTGAALTHESAAFAWGLLKGPGGTLRIVVPATRTVAAPEGTLVVRSRHADTRTHDTAWPHRTTVEHTLWDLAAEARSLDAAVSLLARGCQQRQTTEAQLLRALETRPRQPDRRLMLEVLGEVGDGAESAAEVRYIRDVERAHGLPSAVRQAPDGRGGRRDNEYVEYGLVVEVDGRIGHEGFAGRRHDGWRDRQALREGRQTARVFWHEVTGTPCELAVELGGFLVDRGWSGPLRACRRRGCAVRRR